MESQNYGRVPHIWHAPGQNSEVLDIYLGSVIVGQRLCQEVERVTDLMRHPFAFAKEMNLASKINMLRLDYDQLDLDAEALEKESRKLLAKLRFR